MKTGDFITVYDHLEWGFVIDRKITNLENPIPMKGMLIYDRTVHVTHHVWVVYYRGRIKFYSARYIMEFISEV